MIPQRFLRDALALLCRQGGIVIPTGPWREEIAKAENKEVKLKVFVAK